MKKTLSIFLTLCMLFAVLPIGTLTSNAETSGYYTYTISNGEATITACDTSISGSVRIPRALGGCPVTSIGEKAFYKCYYITSVTIPDSVITIGRNSFLYCSRLESVVIGKNVTSIGDGAFNYCLELTNISIPDSVMNIGGFAFYQTRYYENESNWENNTLYIGKHLIICNGISGSYKIKDGTLTIANEAFWGCTKLTSITIPNSVKSLGYRSFYGCNGLTSINIPDSVSSIGLMAFQDSKNLANITIGNGVENIDNSAFLNTAYYNNLSNWENEVLYIGKYLIACRTYTTQEYIKIKDGTRLIAYGAFKDCSNIVQISFANSVKYINAYAFYNCQNLSAISLSASVLRIDENATGNCDNLVSISFVGTKEQFSQIDIDATCSQFAKENIVRFLSGLTFKIANNQATITKCSNSLVGPITLPSVYEGYPVTKIGDMAFEGCDDITDIIIPDSITHIDRAAFYGCNGLTSITIPDSVTSYGSAIFFKCTNLESITVPKLAYDYSNNPTLGAFWGATTPQDNSSYVPISLKTVILSDNFTMVDRFAFAYCNNLENIIIPNTVTTIGYHAFYGCSGITNITIPDSVTGIEASAFYGCKKLKEITIPDSVTIIGDMAFTYCTSLEKVTLGNGLTSLYEEVFSYCKSLSEISFGKNISIIKGSAFYECSNFKKIDIPSSVTYIGAFAFKNCTGITQINIPSSVKTIDFAAFNACNNLKTVYYGGNKLQWNKIVINNNNDPLLNATINCFHIEERVVESAHNYANNTDKTKTVKISGAASITVSFSSNTALENNYDFIYIYDANGNQVGKYTGTQLASTTVTVIGDTVKIRLKSDSSVNKYGYYADITAIFPHYSYGDSNSDEEINAQDLSIIMNLILSDDIDYRSNIECDANGDGMINLLDLVRLKKYLAGISTVLGK